MIAWEEQLDQREGQFLLETDGTVVYRHPYDERPWRAGSSLHQFRAAAEAWNRYSTLVEGLTDTEQRAIVERLSSDLADAGVLTDTGNGLWDLLLEQANSGML